MTVYSTPQEAIDRVIIPSLGEWAEGFDIQAIADEIIVEHVAAREVWDSYKRAPVEMIDTGASGYKIRDDIDFWEVVAKHDLN